MDKVSIRLEAVKLAVMKGNKDVIEDAKVIEEYILGNANVPEYDDPNLLINDMINKVVSDCNKRNEETEMMMRSIGMNNIFLQKDDEKVE